jgi:hypothetical protein
MRLNRISIIAGLFLLLLSAAPGRAAAAGLDKEKTAYMRRIEDTLLSLADSMYNTPIPDFRTEFCEQFVRQLVRALKTEGSYNYPFDSLGKRINIILPEDKSFRIFNWAIAYADNRLRYYGAIQMNQEQLKLYPLIDNSDILAKSDEDNIVSPKQWNGCFYYNIITKKVQDENVYCLLGVNDGSPISTRKMIDPLRFTEQGPMFGAPIFAIHSEKQASSGINRFILEYKKGVQVAMNWDAERNAILYDELVSQINDPNRKYTYIPSGQFYGLRWSNEQWHVVPNIIPILQLEDGQAPSANDGAPKKRSK